MEINDEEARKRQYEIDKDKYKVLFELAVFVNIVVTHI